MPVFSPLRGEDPRDNLVVSGPDDAELARRAAAIQGMTSVGRGVATAAAGMSAGSSAADAMAAEQAGNQAAFEQARQEMAQSALRAQQFAPEVSSINQVHGVGDALSYAGGQFGQAVTSMAPALAGALILRGRGGPIGSYLGAAAPSYVLERNEALQNQYQDPELAAKPIEDRARAAAAKGAVNMLLESAVPGALGHGIGRAATRPLATVGQALLGEGATEGVQERVGQVANQYVREGSQGLASLGDIATRMPTEAERTNILDASIAGALGGGGVSAPVALTQVGANALGATADTIKDTAQRATHALGNAAIDLKAYTAEQAAAHAARQLDGDAAPLVPGDPAEELLRSTNPEEIQQGLDMQAAQGPERDALTVSNILDRAKELPSQLVRLAQAVKDGTASPESLRAAAMAEDHGRMVGALAKRGVDAATKALDSAKAFVNEGGPKKALDKAVGAVASRLNTQELGDDPKLVDALHNALRPELQDNAEVRGKLGSMSRLFRVLDERSAAPTRKDYEVARQFSDALDMFQDRGVVPKSLRPMFEDVTRARTEAGRDNSWLSMGMVPEFRSNPSARMQVAKIVDKAAVDEGSLDDGDHAMLDHAFGGAKGTREVLTHFQSRMPEFAEKMSASKTADELKVDEGLSESDPNALTQTTPKDTKVQYHFATQDEQPYLAMKDVEGPVTKFSRDGKITPARQAARLMRDKDFSRRPRVISMLQYAKETGKDVGALADTLRKQFAEREEAGKARPGEALVHEAFGNDDAALLARHEILRSEQADNARDLVFDSDPELHAKARVLVDQVRNAKTPEAAAAMRSTHFKVYRRGINASGEQTVRPTTYSAESLWKYFGDKQLAKRKAEGGAATNEPDAVRAQNLFAQAIAEIGQDRNVERIDLPRGLVLDRKLGVTLGQDERAALTKKGKTPRSRKAKAMTAQADRVLEGKQFESRTREMTQDASLTVDERLANLDAVTDTKEFETAKGPRLAYLSRRAAIARQAAEDLAAKFVPHPREAPAQAFDKSEGEAFQEAALREYAAQREYVDDLSEIAEGHPSLQPALDRAQRRLEKLEDGIDPARKYDDLGQSLDIGTKEAAHNASGLRGSARDGVMPSTAPARVAHPAPNITAARTASPETPEFNKLPAPVAGKKTMTYAGVGSRETPPAILAKMTKVAARLEQLGYTLNTGDAAGADAAFRAGAKNKNVFTARDATDTTRAIAKEIHPAPHALRSPYVLNLMARNTNQVFGKNLDTPVDFVVVWTKDGSETERGAGGTGQAMEMAQRKGIPVINAAKPGWEQRLAALVQGEGPGPGAGTSEFAPAPGKPVGKTVTPRTPSQAAAAKSASASYKVGDSFPLVLRDGTAVNVRVAAVMDFAGHQLIAHRETATDYSDAGSRGVPVADPKGNFVVTEPRTSLRVTTSTYPTMKAAMEAAQTRLDNVGEKAFQEAVARQLGTKFNSQQKTSRKPTSLTKAQASAIRGEIDRLLGKGAKVVFKKDLDHTAEYNPTTRLIRISFAAQNHLSAAYHESLHDLRNTLSASPEGRVWWRGLERAASSPPIRAQLAKLLAGHPEALKQIESDPEERVAYMFQFWALGVHEGKQLINLAEQTKGWLAKVARFIRDTFGLVSQHARAEELFDLFYDGKFSDPSVVGEIAREMKLETLGERLRRVSGPIAELSDKIMLTATERLRSFGQAGLDDLANEFQPAVSEEGAKTPLMDGTKTNLAFLPRRAQASAKYRVQMARLFKDTTAAERATAVRNLQAMKPASSPLEHKIRDLLKELWQYQIDRGVKRFEDGQWHALDPFGVKDYFPRKWDAKAVAKNEAGFKALLTSHGMSPKAARDFITAVTTGDGIVPLNNSQWQVGYTPAATHIESRKLDFIDPSNAHMFAPFQVGDLGDVLTTYINQATHRAEFAAQFGNAGERIQQRLDAAADNLSPEDQLAAANTIKALIGTLGANMNPRMKEVMSAVMTAENLILLPLTIFSQVIDALGVGLRANDSKEAWAAFKTGAGEIVRQVRRGKAGDDVAMAETLGIIDDENMLEAMGQAHSGAFMSKFARDTNRRFFKWNGMEAWNRGMRVSAMVAGERFILRNAQKDNRFINELGLDLKDIKAKPDGKRLAITPEDIRASTPSLSKAEAERRSEKIQQALFKFVDGAVLRPNAAQRPVWMSDPHFMLVAHLKQFAFSFHKTILARVANEFDHNNLLPVAILAAYMPVILASDFIKSQITGRPIGDGTLSSVMNHMVMRSGILGTGSFQADAIGDLHRGQLPIVSFMGPSLEHLWMAGRYVVGDPQIDAGRLVDRSFPLARYF